LTVVLSCPRRAALQWREWGTKGRRTAQTERLLSLGEPTLADVSGRDAGAPIPAVRMPTK